MSLPTRSTGGRVLPGCPQRRPRLPRAPRMPGAGAGPTALRARREPRARSPPNGHPPAPGAPRAGIPRSPPNGHPPAPLRLPERRGRAGGPGIAGTVNAAGPGGTGGIPALRDRREGLRGGLTALAASGSGKGDFTTLGLPPLPPGRGRAEPACLCRSVEQLPRSEESSRPRDCRCLSPTAGGEALSQRFQIRAVS